MKIKSMIALSVGMAISTTAVATKPINMTSTNSAEQSQKMLIQHNSKKIRHNNSMILTKRSPKPVLPDVLNPELTDEMYVFDRVGPTIQVAILLDTSGSMNGLISQARLKIWDIINEISKANKNNKDIVLEVALYEYGSSKGTEETGYVNLLNGLTGDLDLLSENLFNLKTNGSKEYSGFAIKKAVDNLVWSQHPDDLKLIIIAGNEEFRQGSTPYEYAIDKAKKSDVIVNTIFCGARNVGVDQEWSRAAKLGGGKFLNINQDKQVRHIITPYDNDINALGVDLNSTYVRYGKLGKEKKARQRAQDLGASMSSKAVMTSRNLAKSSKSYNTGSWDMVDKYEKDGYSAVESHKGSSELNELSTEDFKITLDNKLAKRKEIKRSMKELEKKRSDYIVNNTEKDSSDFGTALLSAVREQAESKGFNFDK